jgi:hypothetical protein
VEARRAQPHSSAWAATHGVLRRVLHLPGTSPTRWAGSERSVAFQTTGCVVGQQPWTPGSGCQQDRGPRHLVRKRDNDPWPEREQDQTMARINHGTH